MTGLLAGALAFTLVVLAVAVVSMLFDSRRVTRLERTIAVANLAVEQVTAERDEARRSLREALNIQRDAYVRLRLPNPAAAQDVQRNQYLPDWAVSSQPQDRSADGVPEVEQETADELTRDLRKIVERNNWPKWPNQ